MFIVLLLPVAQTCVGRGEGGAIAAGMAAGMFTGIATSAIANSGRSSSDDEIRQMRREQQQEKIDQVRRESEAREALRKDEQLRQLDAHLKNVERQQQSSQHAYLLWILAGLVGLLLIALMILGISVMRRNK